MFTSFPVRTAAALLGVAGLCGLAQAQLSWSDVVSYRPPAEQPVYGAQRVAKGVADECFDGVGVDYPPLNPDGSCAQGVPKKNQAYVWGLTQAGIGVPGFTGDEIWFGTFANPLCSGAAGGIIDPEPDLTISWVCEFGQSMPARRPVAPLPPAAGDWRVPRAYSYHLATGRLTERRPTDAAFQGVTGLRSAGSVGSTVFIAGPTFNGWVAFTAWDAGTGAYLGSCRATALDQIRQWVTVNGVLYAGVGRAAGDGAILRWRGTPTDPFPGSGRTSDYCGFEVVGVLPGFPAYLTHMDGTRLAASTWNRTTLSTTRSVAALPQVPLTAGVFVGPAFGADGAYDASDATRPWLRLWSPLQYERDPVVASTTGGGAIAYWRGWLWFGSMQNNATASSSHTLCTLPVCFGIPANADESLTLTLQTSRAASVWRARLVPGAAPEVELLYGQTELPALVPGTKTFELQPTGWTPRHGNAGFGNPFVTYTWAAISGDDDLLFGMYDYRYVFDVRLGLQTGQPIDPRRGYGADLWRFADPQAPASPEATSGFGNFTNYGVRNLLRLAGSGDVMVGTASGLTLQPAAGWELIRLQAPAPTAARRRAR